MEELEETDYAALVTEIKSRIRAAQYQALRAVNKELIDLYWNIGKLIVEKQQGATWGHSVVEQLAADVRSEFPGIQGFSTPNLWRMKQFYEAYGGSQKLSPLVREIGWTHNTIILMNCKDDLEREFYIRMTKAQGWSKNVLIHQIENQTYRKTLLNQTNFAKTLPTESQARAMLAVKDEYIFDFLELGDEFSERQLETAILARVEPFLQQMGGVFAFVGSQYRLQVSDQEYFLDLLPPPASMPGRPGTEDRGVPAGVRRQDAVLPRGAGRRREDAGREPVHRHHPVQIQRPDHRRVRPARVQQAHRRRVVPDGLCPARRIRRADADARADRGAAGRNTRLR